jgi:hypothetical protein
MQAVNFRRISSLFLNELAVPKPTAKESCRLKANI